MNVLARLNVAEAVSPLGIVAILVGLSIVVMVVIILAGGTAWLALRKKPRSTAARQASAAVRAKAPVRTPPRSPTHLPARPVGEAQKPGDDIVPPPARSPEVKPDRLNRPRRPVGEMVEKEQERIAQEISGGAKDWKALFVESFTHAAQEAEETPSETGALLATTPDAQILVNTLNNTAKDVSSGLVGLAEAGDLGWQTRQEKDSIFLDQFVDLGRQLARLVKDDLAVGLSNAEKQNEWPVFDPDAPVRGRSTGDHTPSGQALSSGILEKRPAGSGVMISLAQTVERVTQARETVEMAYREVVNSLRKERTMAGQTTLAKGFDTAKDVLSGGSE